MLSENFARNSELMKLVTSEVRSLFSLQDNRFMKKTVSIPVTKRTTITRAHRKTIVKIQRQTRSPVDPTRSPETNRRFTEVLDTRNNDAPSDLLPVSSVGRPRRKSRHRATIIPEPELSSS